MQVGVDNQAKKFYSKEILDALIKKSKQSCKVGDYLKSIQQGIVTPNHRQQLCEWIFEFCQELGTGPRTPQVAIFYVDNFLAKQAIGDPNALSLLGGAALNLALKVEGEGRINFDELIALTCNNFTRQDFQLAELGILTMVQWDVIPVTASELVRAMLCAYYPNVNFDVVYAKCDTYIEICYSDYNLSLASTHDIAIAAVLAVWEQFGQRNSVLDFIKDFSYDYALDARNMEKCSFDLTNRVGKMLEASPPPISINQYTISQLGYFVFKCRNIKVSSSLNYM